MDSSSEDELTLAQIKATKTKKGRKKKSRSKAPKIWTCHKCLADFITKKDMVTHCKAVHVKVEQPASDEGYKYDHTQEFFTCNTCSAEFQEKEEVEAHITKTHIELFCCEFCDDKFSSAYAFCVHQQKKHSTDMVFKCPLCVYSTKSRPSMSMHLKRHYNKFYFYCKTCGKGFNDSSIFREHDNEHLGIRPFVCIVCDKAFKFSRYLTFHQINCHTVGIEGQIAKTQCKFCNRIFGKEATLNKHISTNHSNTSPGVKRHLCDVCGKGFAKKDKLNIHYRIHTGVKPYSCKYCDKRFIKRDYLTMHERVHTGEKPYSCEYCGKCFNQLTPLNIHIRGHTGVCPYVCQVCGSGFTSKGPLTTHQKFCTGAFQQPTY